MRHKMTTGLAFSVESSVATTDLVLLLSSTSTHHLAEHLLHLILLLNPLSEVLLANTVNLCI